MCENFHNMSAKDWQESVTLIAWAGQGLEIKVST